MRTLFFLSIESGYGGAERSLEIILRHFPQNLRILVFVESELHWQRLMQPGALPSNARLIRVTGSQYVFGRRLAALRLLLAYVRYRPQAIVLNTHRSALIAAMAARFARSLAHRCHLYVRDFFWQDLDFIFSRLAGARLLVPHVAVMQRLGYLKPLHVAPFGPMPWAVMPDMVEVAEEPTSYAGPILHLATLNPWKGHFDLALAVHHLHSQQRPVSLLSCGLVSSVSLQRDLQQLIARLGITDRYQIDERLADPSPLLQNCCAVVVASVSHSGGPETFGRTIIEAWAHRKPVIAYRVGAPATLISHEVDGLLVEEGDTQALAEALWRLAASPALCQRLGEAGYAKVTAHYDASQVTSRLLEYLTSGGERAE
jgi:glycosyltransferase involved in cell wall biosynthesis